MLWIYWFNMLQHPHSIWICAFCALCSVYWYTVCTVLGRCTTAVLHTHTYLKNHTYIYYSRGVLYTYNTPRHTATIHTPSCTASLFPCKRKHFEIWAILLINNIQSILLWCFVIIYTNFNHTFPPNASRHDGKCRKQEKRDCWMEKRTSKMINVKTEKSWEKFFSLHFPGANLLMLHVHFFFICFCSHRILIFANIMPVSSRAYTPRDPCAIISDTTISW